VEEDRGRPFRDLALGEFVERLASAEPVPGGGSASAVVASLAASLVAMVAGLSEGRPKYAEHADLIADAKAAGAALADRCLRLADEDADAYAGFAAALKLPKETDEELAARSTALAAAARTAALVPLDAVEACRDIVRAAGSIAGRSNANAASDLAVAALLAEASARGAAANVIVNLPSTNDEAFAAELTSRVEDLLAEVERLAATTRETVRAATGRPTASTTA
jgi:glutamate formiminotransferase/formiminotetrahydrofolate cyclodeaminase